LSNNQTHGYVDFPFINKKANSGSVLFQNKTNPISKGENTISLKAYSVSNYSFPL